ncbi:MFS transporter [Shimia marina]|uniref:D-galactonate transporter n=1 Tax=Shimia marina TaxID=321267 RepID=A0A0P1EPZ3_9RHOB|nr:MFS transporter [Shimia marina]CUH52470.1 D-galactonate transporter [Shimia marina]SFE12662.1 Predicted arabinose efflux permease, MFS family [Shimia marina]
MRFDLVLLCLAYVLSQFFRAFLAVLTQVLETDIGATAADLAFASGLWFLIFAAMQIPVGAALDRFGPRRTTAILLLLGGGGGAALFALATTPFHIAVAMALIGIGCSPVLMASYFIFARSYPPARFATLAALTLGVGSVGNLIAAYPTAWAAETIGWRATLWVLAAVSSLLAIAAWRMVQDPPAAQSDTRGSVLDLLKLPAVWLLIPLMFFNYMPSAGIRGLWIGPYLSDVFSLTTGEVGQATLAMGLSMILGTFVYGPADRILGTRKWIIIGGASISATALLLLTIFANHSALSAIVLMSIVGFAGAAFPVMIAHSRSFFPEHLTGRGVTLMNLFGIGGVGVMQFGSGKLHSTIAPENPLLAYQVIFAGLAALLIIGALIYCFSEDRLD